MRNSAYVNTNNEYNYTATVYDLEDLKAWCKSENLSDADIAKFTLHKEVGNEIEKEVADWINSKKVN